MEKCLRAISLNKIYILYEIIKSSDYKWGETYQYTISYVRQF